MKGRNSSNNQFFVFKNTEAFSEKEKVFFSFFSFWCFFLLVVGDVLS